MDEVKEDSQVNPAEHSDALSAEIQPEPAEPAGWTIFLTVNTAVMSHRTNGDVLLPLTHVGAFLQRGASPLLEVPATVGVPRLQAQSGQKKNKTQSYKLIKRTTGN